MAIKIYQSQVKSAQLGSIGGSGVQNAVLKVEEDPLLKVALTSAGRVTKALADKAEGDKELQQATDILDESNTMYEATQLYETEYKLKHKGKEARDAAADYKAWHEKQYNESSKRFQGDARQSFMWKKQAGQIQMGSTSRAMAYASQQDTLYKKEVTAQLSVNYLQKIATATDDRFVNNMRAQTNNQIAALNSPEATAVIMAELDQQTGVTRINTALANDDVDEAKRLLSEYMEVGVLGTQTDELINRVDVASDNQKAYNISLQIRDELPAGTKTEKLDLVRVLAGDDQEVYKLSRDQVNQDHSAAEAMQRDQDIKVTNMYTARIAAANTPELRKAVELQFTTDPNVSLPVLNKLNAMNSKGLSHRTSSTEGLAQRMEQKIADDTMTEDDLEKPEVKYNLSKADYDRLDGLRKETGGNRVSGYNLSLDARLANALGGAPKTKAKHVKRFKGLMNQFTKEYQTANGKLPGDKELKDQENWLMEQVIYDEDLFTPDETTSRFLIDTLDPSKFDVPKQIKSDIVKALKAADVEATPEAIIRTYKLYLMDKDNG